MDTFNLTFFYIYLHFNHAKKNQQIDGWKLVWSDEFDGQQIDLSIGHSILVQELLHLKI